MNNRTASQSRYWDNIAHAYSQRYGLDSQSGQAKIRRKAERLIAGAQIKEYDEILEIGCGTGVFTRELAQTEATLTAIDISNNMLSVALSNKPPNVNYLIDDAHKTMFAPERFDSIVGCYVLQYLDLSVALPEFFRILKPGGRMAFIDINMLNPLAFAKTKIKLVKRLLNISGEAVSFTPWGLRKWFLRYDFTDVKVTPFEFGGKLNILEGMPIIRQLGGSLLVTARKQ